MSLPSVQTLRNEFCDWGRLHNWPGASILGADTSWSQELTFSRHPKNRVLGVTEVTGCEKRVNKYYLDGRCAESPSPDLGPPATVPPDKRANMDKGLICPREKELGQNFTWGRSFIKGQDDNSG